MNTTALALVLYVGWFLLLLFAIIAVRFHAATAHGKPANSFRSDGSDLSPLSARLCGAHANGFESFPFIAGPLLLALATGTSGLTDGLAMLLPAARVGQSTAHVVSGSSAAAQVRFGFFLVQVLLSVYFLYRLGLHFAAR